MMFYSNLYFTDGIIYSEARKHKISPPLEEFADILDLPYNGPRFKPYEPKEGDKYMYKSVAPSFMLDPNSHVSYPLTRGFVHLEISLIHYMKNHILFRRKRNLSHLTRYYVATIWLLSNKVETNKESVVIQHTWKSNRKGICLPYCDLVTEILEHVKYNFEGNLLV